MDNITKYFKKVDKDICTIIIVGVVLFILWISFSRKEYYIKKRGKVIMSEDEFNKRQDSANRIIDQNNKCQEELGSYRKAEHNDEPTQVDNSQPSGNSVETTSAYSGNVSGGDVNESFNPSFGPMFGRIGGKSMGIKRDIGKSGWGDGPAPYV